MHVGIEQLQLLHVQKSIGKQNLCLIPSDKIFMSLSENKYFIATVDLLFQEFILASFKRLKSFTPLASDVLI